MKDLVGVGIADPAEEVRIGQRAFERVVLARERTREAREIALERLDSAGIELGEFRATANGDERRALLRAGFGEQERAALEVERGESELLRHRAPLLAPTESARDHQVHDEEELAVEREDDALADAAQRGDAPALELGELRFDRAQEERALEPHSFELDAANAPFEVFDVERDVG